VRSISRSCSSLIRFAVYPDIGEYKKIVEQSEEAIRLKPDFPVPYAFLMFGDIALNRFEEAKGTYRKASEGKLYSPLFPLALYQIAFVQNDAAGTARQVEGSAGQPGLEGTLLANEADTAAYSGGLGQAREFSRQAMDSAERAGEKETAATYSAVAALREGLLGTAQEVRQDATLALKRSTWFDSEYGSALALAMRGRCASTEPDGRFGQEVSGSYNRAV